MADRTVKLRRLIEILRSRGVTYISYRGKGSHAMFRNTVNGREVSYPVPTTRDDVLVGYVRAARKKFKLTADDGVSDRDFYED